MSSTVSFRFKNSISTEQVSFTGSVITIGDVKRLIAIKRGLGAEGAPELTLFDSSTGAEYGDDAKVIPRNTLVVVKRVPLVRLQPLQAGGAPTGSAGVGPASAVAANGGDTSSAAGDEFGGDYFSDKPTAAVVREEEDKALASLLQGTATTWQREVRQGAMRGRGMGRGRGRGAPMDYRCPRCEAVGQHWVSDCPTQGDPNFDKRRVRPPVGIPMTRLARSQEGGLVLPDGQTGTLIANEDAFAREILGLPTAAPAAPASTAAEPVAALPAAAEAKPEAVAALPAPDQTTAQVAGGVKPEPLLLLDSKPAAEAEAAAGVAEVAPVAPQAAVPMPALLDQRPASTPPVLPQLAGEQELSGAAAKPPPASMFSMWLQGGLLPRGPPDFLRRAFDRDEPLPRSEFERAQDEYRQRFQLPRLLRRPASPPRRRSPSRRSRSRSRDRRRSPSRKEERGGRGSEDRKERREERKERKRSRSRERRSRSREHKHGRSQASKERRRSRERSRERSKRRDSGAGDAAAVDAGGSERKQQPEAMPAPSHVDDRPQDSSKQAGEPAGEQQQPAEVAAPAGDNVPVEEVPAEAKKEDRHHKERRSKEERREHKHKKEKREKKERKDKERDRERRRSRSREREHHRSGGNESKRSRKA